MPQCGYGVGGSGRPGLIVGNHFHAVQSVSTQTTHHTSLLCRAYIVGVRNPFLKYQSIDKKVKLKKLYQIYINKCITFSSCPNQSRISLFGGVAPVSPLVISQFLEPMTMMHHFTHSVELTNQNNGNTPLENFKLSEMIEPDLLSDTVKKIMLPLMN